MNTPSRPFPPNSIILLFALLTSLILFALLFSAETSPAPVVVLNRPYKVPMLFRDRIGAWIPRSPAWAWALRIEDAIFGRRAVMNLSTQVCKMPDSCAQGATVYGLGVPDFSSPNGFQLWFLPEPELKALRTSLNQSRAETISRPRITTAEGAAASLFTGETIVVSGNTNRVGIEAAYFARKHPGGTDLFATVRMTDVVTNCFHRPDQQPTQPMIQTNLDVTMRLQIPKGCGVFFMNAPATNSSRQCFGVLIDPP